MENNFLKKTFLPLLSMPYFWVRFIAFSVILACNSFVRVFFHIGPAGPEFSYAIVVPTLAILLLAVILFFVFEIKTLIKLKPSFDFLKQPLFIAWLVFSSICFISGIINLAPLYSTVIFVFMPLFVLMLKEQNFDKFFLLSFALTFFVNAIAGLIWHPLFSNSFALSFSALVPCILCVVIHALLSGKDRKNIFFAIIALIVLLYFTNLSGGRSGLLAIVFTIVCFIFATLIKLSVKKRQTKCNYKTVAIITVSALVVLVTLIVCGINFLENHFVPSENAESIEGLSTFQKFIVSIKNGNPFSSRGTIWQYTLENANFTGHSPAFYLDTDGILAEHQNQAHNVFFAVLGHYGIFAFIAFIIFCVMATVRSVYYALTNDFLCFFPFLSLITFFTAGICEDVLIMWNPQLLTLLFYGACAFLIVKTEKQKKLNT